MWINKKELNKLIDERVKKQVEEQVEKELIDFFNIDSWNKIVFTAADQTDSDLTIRHELRNLGKAKTDFKHIIKKLVYNFDTRPAKELLENAFAQIDKKLDSDETTKKLVKNINKFQLKK